MKADHFRRRWLARATALLRGPAWAQSPSPAPSATSGTPALHDPAADRPVPLAAPAPLARLQAGADDNGHVAVFAGPSTRYAHGVLGDAVEATTLLRLERHDLEPMLRLELPPPHVFEDIAPRAIAWRGRRALLTVRSGPLGAQLAVVARAAGRGSFELATLGAPIGQQNRWLSPSTDGQRLLAVHTPHIGGVLRTYTARGDRLAGREVARELSNHSIGQRELDVSAWVSARWVVPAQDRRRLHVFDLG